MDLEEQTSNTVITSTDDSDLCGLFNTQEEGNKVLDNHEQASTLGDDQINLSNGNATQQS